jgi:cytochrome c biogenesis protein CcdA/thiol-disulfide isomerase/thioredoxin
MALLLIFAFIAGAGTAVSPCVLPVLPALLSAGATGGRRRPLGIVCGLVVTYTVAVVALTTVIDGVGLAGGTVRTIAVVVIAVFGVGLLWPRVGQALERPLLRLARFGPTESGHGFWSGTVVGGALGFVYAPCAGPILAAVVAAGATRTTSAEEIAVALAYGLGSGVVLLVLALGGRRVGDRIRAAGRGPGLQRALGVVLVLTAVAMATQLDVRFQTAIADHLPGFVTNPTGGIERSHAVEKRLAALRGRSRFDAATAEARPPRGSTGAEARYPDLGRAPGFAGGGRWFDTPGGRPLGRSALRGRVVLVDFWTYTCINCIRTLPYVTAWDARYRRAGLTVVGVHTPEFPFEHEASNVRSAIAQNHIRYPVVQDNAYKIWNAFGNQYWPAEYLIDTRGRVRYTHFGEGDDTATESAIRTLLAERGDRALGTRTHPHALAPGSGPQTPETYLGAKQAEGWLPGPPAEGTHDYPGMADPPLNGFSFGGRWSITGEAATAVRGASITARFQARRVYLVMHSRAGRPRRVGVSVDGRAQPAVTVRGDRLYQLVDLPRAGEHRLRVRLAPGVSGYAFTFG